MFNFQTQFSRWSVSPVKHGSIDFDIWLNFEAIELNKLTVKSVFSSTTRKFA